MQKRLVGREQEFGIEIRPPFKPEPEQRRQKPPYENPDDFDMWRSGFVISLLEEIGQQVPSYKAPGWGGRYWLINGSLVYMDQSTIEIANAEHLAGSLDGLLQEKATELIAVAAAKAVVEKKGIVSLALYKNTVGPSNPEKPWEEATYGSHHNYSYLADKNKQVYAVLANFLPISLPLSGSGHIQRPVFTADCHYVLSQRASHICREKDAATVADRPIVNIREESLMDASAGFGRLHIISRDASRCEFQTWLVDMTTHLVLRLVEEGWELPSQLSLVNPLSELQKINSFLLSENDCKIECKGGQLMDVVDYNRLFLNAAKQLNPLSDAEKQGLREWERVLELLKARAFDKLVGELDWATKWFLLKKKMSQHNFDLGSVQALKINMGYHNISPSPKESQFARLDEDGYIKHLVGQEDIEKAKTIAPDTRAKSRGEFIKLLFNQYKPLIKEQSGIDIDWGKVSLRVPGFERIDIYFGEPDNPFTSYSSTLKKFRRKFNL